jgi:hypothetical protein
MPLQYLLDEHLDPDYRMGLTRREPELRVRRIGDPDAPSTGILDPPLLRWCEDNDFVLVTANRRSMPVHLAEHLSQGRHVPGILILRRTAAMGAVIDDLLLISGASIEAELRDQIVYVPLG